VRRSAPAVVLSALVAVALAGCGGGGGGAQTTPGKQVSAISDGAALYTSLGCASCHTTDGANRVGPTFKGLAGSTVKLVGGGTVKADAGYLRASILRPDAQVVEGFQAHIMANATGPLKLDAKPQQVAALVAFIQQVGGRAG
jgi:cytochrome c oxidase subunit II